MAASAAADEQRAVPVVDDPGVVPGCEPAGAEPIGEGDHRVDPQLAVAEDAWVRGAPLRVAAQERVHDAGPEFVLQVQGQVRDAERVRDPPGAQHRLGRAAAALAVGALVGPELERHRDYLSPRLALPQRRDRGVNPAAERHQDALPLARSIGDGQAGAGEAGERAVKCVRGEGRGVAVARPQAAELGGDPVGIDASGREHVRLLHQLRRGRGGRRGRRAALVVEADGVDPPVRNRQ